VSTSCVTDAELVARARTGDHAAFGDLVDRHRTAVYRAALTALRSHAEAEDAAQDAFVLAWRRLGSFRGDASFKTWLLTIAWHQAINRRRGLMGRWRRMISFEDVTVRRETTYAEAVGVVAASDAGSGFGRIMGATPEQLMADHELGRDIERGIRALSPKLRDTLLLAQSGEYSYEEIATMLKAPLGTIKWRVSKARRTVKKFLGERGYGNV
jgi:RNA polymerase sigma-70 factor (ECF subfamily)